MRVKCISCGNELNLDHWIFEDYSGPVKCFSCSAMMEVKSTGGEIYSINPLAVYESKSGVQSVLPKSGLRRSSLPDGSREGEVSERLYRN